MIVGPILYFPPISFFSLWKNRNALLIEQYETYQKRTFRNKCRILSPNGPLLLSIPLEKGKNNSQLITNVKIAYHQDWVRQHLMTIRTCYGKAPYFEFYYSSIENLLEQRPEKLFHLNIALLNYLKEVVGIDFELKYTNQYLKDYHHTSLDLRNRFETQSLNYLNKKSSCKKYVQVFEEKNGFVQDLSILDLLFCMGPETASYL